MPGLSRSWRILEAVVGIVPDDELSGFAGELLGPTPWDGKGPLPDGAVRVHQSGRLKGDGTRLMAWVKRPTGEYDVTIYSEPEWTDAVVPGSRIRFDR